MTRPEARYQAPAVADTCGLACASSDPTHALDHETIARLAAQVDEMRTALKVARDFVKHHPAVNGNWPLVVDIIEGAIRG